MQSVKMKINMKKHTEYSGEPLITTPSENRTRDGLFFSFAFFAAVNNADFLVV